MSLLDRYRACMVLHSVGDAMGYHNNKWEFNFVGVDIHKEMEALGGIDNLKLNAKQWPASDDTILNLANAEALIENKDVKPSDQLYKNIIHHYKAGMRDMKGRAPGNTTIAAVSSLSEFKECGFKIPFNARGGGCGASMRSPCIGLRYSTPEQLNELIQFSVESGRMTHHHPMGYLGATAAALMVSYAIQEIPVNKWGANCLKHFDLAHEYVKSSGHCSTENLKMNNWSGVIEHWTRYLKLRNIESGNSEPVFPDKYGVKERDAAYKTFTESKWAGSNGIDSVLIAYDSLLGCGGDWRKLCKRAMLHGGDNDSTGCIAGALYGAMNGFKGVDKNNYEKIEYFSRIMDCGEKLF